MTPAQLREAMVDNQIRPSDVTRYDILAAFLNTKREAFVPKEYSSLAYSEYEIPLNDSRKMMTPRSWAKLVSTASPQAHEEVLLIGAGLGYEAAILSQHGTTVIAIENERDLAKHAENNLASLGYDNAIVIGGKLTQGAKKSGPYDLIIFSGAIENLPSTIAEQLKTDGRIVAYCVEGAVTIARSFFNASGNLTSRDAFNASSPKLPGFEKREEFAF